MTLVTARITNDAKLEAKARAAGFKLSEVKEALEKYILSETIQDVQVCMKCTHKCNIILHYYITYIYNFQGGE